MKKVLAVILVVAAVFSAGSVFAEDGEKMTVYDVKFGTAYKIKGFAVVTFQEFSFIDTKYVSNGNNIESGAEADIAYLRADIRNLAKKDVKFMGTISVKAIYDDEYEYNGFIYQLNHKSESFRGESEIGPMYTGHYGFFCQLPNFIVQDKSAPLRMIITINGHEFIYNIRK